MKKPDFSGFRSRSFRAGGYSLLVCALAVAIAIAVNLLAGALPESLTKQDVTKQKLFTLSAQSENLVSSLDEDITVYWVVQAGQEDANIEQLLSQYESRSTHLKVVVRDPDVYPDFLSQYDVSETYNNSLVVVSAQRYRYLSYYDIYTYDASSYYTTGQYTTQFAGEQVLTGAIAYVTSDSLPLIYLTTGHGEATLSTQFADAVSKANLETKTLSLLTVEAIPEDAGALFINAPDTDFTQEEIDILAAYLENGGNLLYISQPPKKQAPEKLEALLATYGITSNPGIVLEGNGNYYALSTPYYLMPDMESHAITNPLIDGNYYCMLPVAQGLTVATDQPENISATALLTTSSRAYSKLAGYQLTTYEKENGDIAGPFALAAQSTKTLDDGLESRLVWIGSTGITDDDANARVSGGNQDLFLNALDWLCDQEQSVTIHAKTLGTNYLTMSDATANILSILVLAVIPGTLLALGIVLNVRRKRR